jgi:thioredoxin-like negative regulator of GroEL
VVREIAEALAGKAAVASINTEDNPRLARQFNITGIPALLLIRNGSVIDRLSGAQPKENVIAWVSRHNV